jgi:hypothetical protein
MAPLFVRVCVRSQVGADVEERDELDDEALARLQEWAPPAALVTAEAVRAEVTRPRRVANASRRVANACCCVATR